MTKKSIKKTGFTLIELLITTALTVILMLTVTALFMTFLLSNSRTNTQKAIKEEGIHAMSQMEFILRNARYIDVESTPCITGMSTIDVISADGGLTTFRTITDGGVPKIASNSAFLTSGSVNVSNPPLRFNCSGSLGNRRVKITFGLSKTSPDGNVNEVFESTVNIRN
jgi:prepilin-type N-terminal cleavage/methylation domain-containing protein